MNKTSGENMDDGAIFADGKLYEQMKPLLMKIAEQQQQIYELQRKNSVLSGEPQQENGGRQDVVAFSSETAFKKGTVVPDYGSYNAETHRIELRQGFCFEAVAAFNPDGSINEKPKDDAPDRIVILSKTDENGERIEKRMPEQSYKKIIEIQEYFERGKKNTTEDTNGWTRLDDYYARKMGVKVDELRLNTWENFLHNYQIYCKRYANNESQAFKQAARLVNDMIPETRAYFNEQRKRYGKEEFDKRLHEEYINAKDVEVGEEFYFASDNPNTQAEEPNGVTKHDNELLAGTPIADTSFKVGDTIPMSFRIKGFYGEREAVNPVSDYKITKISKGFKPERAILYSATARSAYCVYLPDLVAYLKKYERQKGIAPLTDKYAYEFEEGKHKPKIKEKRPSWFDRHKSAKAKARTEEARRSFDTAILNASNREI